jgi:soluble lytic murein transglycosylase
VIKTVKTNKAWIAIVFLLAITGTLHYYSLSFLKSYVFPVKYEADILESAVEFGVDPNLVLAVIKTESNFDPAAVSSAGALGIMQITPETFEWLQQRLNHSISLNQKALFTPGTNIRYGTYFISLLKSEFATDETVICAYHAGRGKVKSWLRNSKYSKDGKHLDTIPFESTKSYVGAVLHNYEEYKAFYAK